jgi:hypothetical protein
VSTLYETYPLYQRGTVDSHRTAPSTRNVTRFVTDRRYPVQYEVFVGSYR